MKFVPFALLAGLLALPACDKKKDLPPANSDPAAGGYQGSKAGPPGGMTPPAPSGGTGTGAAAGSGQAVTAAWGDNLVGPAREQSELNLKQIGLAMHNAHDAANAFPAGIYDASGKALGLSWRVAILPYLEQGTLFKMFKLDEPWDSEANKKLLPMMPKVYAPPGNTTAAGHTFYRGFTGKGMLFEPPTTPGKPGTVAAGKKIVQISDGTTNTAMVVEGAEAVPWTKPDAFDLDPKNPAASIGGVFAAGACGVRCDGSRVFLKKTIDGATLRNFALIADGSILTIP